MLSMLRISGVSLIQSLDTFSSERGGLTMYLMTGSVPGALPGVDFPIGWAGDGVRVVLAGALFVSAHATLPEPGRSEGG
jgi:hypothetical protein